MANDNHLDSDGPGCAAIELDSLPDATFSTLKALLTPKPEHRIVAKSGGQYGGQVPLPPGKYIVTEPPTPNPALVSKRYLQAVTLPFSEVLAGFLSTIQIGDSFTADDFRQYTIQAKTRAFAQLFLKSSYSQAFKHILRGSSYIKTNEDDTYTYLRARSKANPYSRPKVIDSRTMPKSLEEALLASLKIASKGRLQASHQNHIIESYRGFTKFPDDLEDAIDALVAKGLVTQTGLGTLVLV